MPSWGLTLVLQTVGQGEVIGMGVHGGAVEVSQLLQRMGQAESGSQRAGVPGGREHGAPRTRGQSVAGTWSVSGLPGTCLWKG